MRLFRSTLENHLQVARRDCEAESLARHMAERSVDDMIRQHRDELANKENHIHMVRAYYASLTTFFFLKLWTW